MNADDAALAAYLFHGASITRDALRREWMLWATAPEVLFVLACSPCTPVADSGAGLGLDHPDIYLTTTLVPEVCNHFDVPFCTGEHHHNLARKHDGAVIKAIDRAFAPQMTRTPLVAGAPCGIEEFRDLGHAGLRHRCCVNFERVDVQHWIGPCPLLQRPRARPVVIADILDDPDDVPSGCFINRGRLRLLNVVLPLSRDKPTVAAILTLGEPGSPLFRGSRVTFHEKLFCRFCNGKRDDRLYVLYRWESAAEVLLFHDSRTEPDYVHGIRPSCLIQHEFSINVLHSGGVAGAFTSFGVPPVGPAKQLVLVDGRARRFTTPEMFKVGGDHDALELYTDAVPAITDSALQSKPGKSLHMHLAVMIVVRLRRRIRAFLDARAAGVPRSARPEVALALSARDLALVHSAIFFVALTDSTPVVLVGRDFTSVVMVSDEPAEHRTALHGCPQLTRVFEDTCGYVPEPFLAGSLDVAGDTRHVVACPIGDCDTACLDGSLLAWFSMDEISAGNADLHSLCALALGTILCLLDHPQCHG